MIEALAYGRKYRMPDDAKRVPDFRRSRGPRGPTSRSLVRLALACQSAEEMGKRLRQRFEARRGGVTGGASPLAEAELAERLDWPLVD